MRTYHIHFYGKIEKAEDKQKQQRAIYQRYFVASAKCLHSLLGNNCPKIDIIFPSYILTQNVLAGCSPNDERVISGKLNVDGFPPVGTYLEEGAPYYRYQLIIFCKAKIVICMSDTKQTVTKLILAANAD